uniref:Uncharacterized protein n=1 Tax=Panagrolaimus sp. JU765 TaxID=591449 RepID=A0AC34Q544_9BILA
SVIMPLIKLNLFINRLTDPDDRSARFDTELVSECQKLQNISEYIKRVVTEGCRLHNTEPFVKTEEIWLQLRQKYILSPFHRNERYLPWMWNTDQIHLKKRKI